MSKETESSVPTRNAWVRLPALILFVVLFDVLEFVVVLVMLVQFVFHLFTGKANPRLKETGKNLATYAQEIIAYLTYQVDDLPYPFTPWPQVKKEPAPPKKPAPKSKKT